jgi:hypothetical protein
MPGRGAKEHNTPGVSEFVAFWSLASLPRLPLTAAPAFAAQAWAMAGLWWV